MWCGRPRRWIALLVAAVAYLTACSPLAAAEQHPPLVTGEFFGVSGSQVAAIHDRSPAEAAHHLAKISQAGAEYLRMPMLWRTREPNPPVAGVHTYNWGPSDTLVGALARADLRMQPTIIQAPDWAQDPITGPLCGSQAGVAAGRAQDFGRFVGALAARYGRNGTFWAENPHLPYRPMQSYQIWNEPNRHSWCPGPNPEVYGEMYMAARTAIRTTDPSAGAIMAGLTPLRYGSYADNTQVTLGIGEFLKRMVDHSPDLAGNVDAVAVHLYKPGPDQFFANIAWFRSELRRYRLGETPMVISEFGWSGAGGPAGIPESSRAELFAEVAGKLPRTDCNIRGAVAFTWTTAELNPHSLEHWYGIADPQSGELHPSGRAYFDQVERFRGRGDAPPPRKTIRICGGPSPDSDGDGIPDEDDEFPLDPARGGSGVQGPSESPQPQSEPLVPESFFGVVLARGHEPLQQWVHTDSMSKAGVGRAQFPFQWSRIEPQAPGSASHTRDWSSLDRRLLQIGSQEIAVWPRVESAPQWASSLGLPTQAYADLLGELADRYGAGGAFWDENPHLNPDLAPREFEVWSRANLDAAWWDGSASPAEYADAYSKARAAIRAAAPEAHAIVSLTHSGVGGRAGMFLRGMVDSQPELQGGIDGVVVRDTKSTSASGLETTIADVRRALDQTGNKDATIKLVFGASTNGPGAITEAERVALYRETMSRIGRTDCGVDGIFARSWETPSSNPSIDDDWFGIADPVTAALSPTGVEYRTQARRLLGRESGEIDRRTLYVCGDPPAATDPADTRPPRSAIHSGPAGPTNDPSPRFSFSADEDGSTFECRLEGEWSPCSSPQDYPGLGDGDYTFRVRATDLAGNVEVDPPSRSFTIDTLPPRLAIEGGPAGPTNQARPVFRYDAEGGAVLECAIAPAGAGPAFGPCSTGSTHSPASSLDDGPHTFIVRATDPAGNRTARNRAFSVDTRPPVTRIGSGPEGRTSDPSPQFAFDADEPGVRFECRIEGEAWRSCSSPHDYRELPDGTHRFAVRATDAAGNVETNPPHRTFTVEKQDAVEAPNPLAVTVAVNKRAKAAKPVTVKVTCDRDCEATAKGTVSFGSLPARGTTRKQRRGGGRLKPVSGPLEAGVVGKFRLRPSRRTARAVTRAVRRGGRASAKLEITVRNADGSSAAARATVRLR